MQPNTEKLIDMRYSLLFLPDTYSLHTEAFCLNLENRNPIVRIKNESHKKEITEILKKKNSAGFILYSDESDCLDLTDSLFVYQTETKRFFIESVVDIGLIDKNSIECRSIRDVFNHMLYIKSNVSETFMLYSATSPDILKKNNKNPMHVFEYENKRELYSLIKGFQSELKNFSIKDLKLLEKPLQQQVW